VQYINMANYNIVPANVFQFEAACSPA